MSRENLDTKQLYELYCNYSDGFGNHGPVLSEFANVLWKYKSLWSQWMPFHVEDIDAHMEHLEDRYKKNIIFDAGIVLGILILHLLLPGNLGWFIIAVISGVIMSVKSKESAWCVSILIVSFIVAFTGWTLDFNTNPMFFIFLCVMTGLNAALAYKNMVEENKKMENLHKIDTQKVITKKGIEKQLDEYRDKMFKLLPELRKEYKDIFQDILNKNDGIATERQQQDWRELPDKFWWEISPDVLYEWEKQLSNGRNERDFSQTWEFQAIERPLGKEFQQAGFEYSPLESDDLSESELNFVYQQKKAAIGKSSPKLLDFIGAVVDSNIASETVSYIDYAYSDIQRLAKTMEWNGIKSNITTAYKDGELTEKDYNSLMSEYNYRSLEAYSLINEKVEKTYEQKKEIKTATFFWCGQMILVPDASVANGYILICYHCQFQHIFENLETLKRYNITRIAGNEKERNVAFLAKIHQMYPKCR